MEIKGMHAMSRLVLTSISSCAILAAGLTAADSPPAKAEYIDSASTAVKGTSMGDAKFSFVAGADPAVEPIATFGFNEIARIGGMMVSQVNEALVNDDIGVAVAAMHLKNMELPKPVAGKLALTAVKRTSLMLRDPLNTPDAADAAALERIHEQLMNDEKPDAMIVQRIDRPGQPVEWRVYRPIATSKSCLVCHGDPAKFRPEVKAALDHLYPQDKAVDYQAQEYRGVIRVSIAAPAAK
jgi:Protein of unknown function (DUF3365)